MELNREGGITSIRVLHVIGAYYPATVYGGPIYSVHNLCRELAGSGNASVDVLTTDINGKGRLPVESSARRNVEGVGVSYCRTTIGEKVVLSLEHVAATFRQVESYDIVHLHSVFSLTTLFSARFCRLRRVPYVVSPRGSLVPELIERRGRWKKSAWIKTFERRNLELASAVHATTDIEAQGILGLGIKPRHLAVIPNGVDVDLFVSSKAEQVAAFRDKFKIPVNEEIILFLGRINWKKGLDVLVPACKFLVRAGLPIRLVIAGPDSNGYRSVVERIVYEEGVGHNVTFTGPLAGTEKKACLSASRIVVLPSVSENFGIAAAEGMAMGKPVVVTEGVGIAQDVQQCGGGLVVPFNAVRLAEGMESILRAPALARELGGRAAAFAKAHYSWPAISDQVLRLYREILGKKGNQ